MATTTSNNLYDPEVWAALAAAEFTGRTVIQSSGAVVEDPSLEGVPGSTVDFPAWMALGDLDDLTEAVPMVPEVLTQKATQAVVKEAGKAVEISDTAKLVGLGNAQDEAIRQFGILAARKVDADLMAAATATITGGVTYADGRAATDSKPLTWTGEAGLGMGWEAYVAATAAFGDELEPEEFAGIYINSAQRGQLFRDEQFIKSDGETGGSVIRRGLIGDLGGIPVYVTNRVAANRFVIAKRNSLGLLYKRRPLVEQDRDILKRSTIVTTNLHYATKRLNDRGILVGDLTPAAG